MPLYYAVHTPLERWVPAARPRARVLFVVCFILLAVASEVLLRVLQPKKIRDRLWRRFLSDWPASPVEQKYR
jgi:hypothetical protein